MCLAIPGKIIEIHNNDELRMATVDFSGITKEICIQFLEDVKIGDYILTHVGYALNKIDEDEAKKTLSLIENL